MDILIVAGEAAPYQQTSDIANVVTGMSTELARQGHDVRLVIPLYRRLFLPTPPAGPLAQIQVPLGTYSRQAVLWRVDHTFDETLQLPVYLVDAPFYFRRDNPYGYLDDYERFIFFTRAVVELIQGQGLAGWKPQVIHGHDWIAGLIPMWLRQGSGRRKDAPDAFVYTLHNAGFPGQFSTRALGAAGLTDLGVYRHLGETDNRISFMARGILAADAVNTVSPRHAEEIASGAYAAGLGPALQARATPLVGILNGLDYAAYDPAFDSQIVRTFSRDRLAQRLENKRDLQRECGFAVDDGIPLLALVNRLIADKGVGLLERILPDLVEQDGAQVVIVGTVGDYRYREALGNLARRYGQQVAAFFSADDALQRRVFAGADILLMPSRIESCGLQQMIAMHYGAVPVVRRTGGLADTVAPHADRNATGGRGFLFDEFSPDCFHQSIRAALALYRADQRTWQGLQRHNMTVELSWSRPAGQYLDLYEQALAASQGRPALPRGTPLQADPAELLVHTILEIDELAMAADQAEYLKQVARSIRGLLRSQAVLLWVQDETAPEQLRLGAPSFDPGSPEGQRDTEPAHIFPEQAGRSWQYVYRREAAAAIPQTQLGFLDSELARQQDWAVQLSTPLNAHGTTLGQIDVFYHDPQHVPSERDISTLSALASTLAVNLEKLRLGRQRDLLLEADRAMAQARTLGDLAQGVLRYARRLTCASTARLQLDDGVVYHLDQGENLTSGEKAAAAGGDPGALPRGGRASTICAALPIGESQSAGQITVSKEPPAWFSRDDEAALGYLADQAANAVLAAQRRDQRDQDRVEQLRRLAASLIGGGDFDYLLQRVVETTAQVLEAQAASLYLIDEEDGRLKIRAASGYHAPLLKTGASYTLGEGVTGWIAQQGQAVRADSLKELHLHPAWKGRHTQDQGGREPSAFLGIPLKIVDRITGQERVIGVLKLEDRAETLQPQTVFTAEHVRLGEMMANVIATVVYNTQVSETQLQRFGHNLGTLSQALAGGLRMGELEEQIVKMMARALGAEAAALYLVDEESGRLVARAGAGYQAALVAAGASYNLGEGITGWIAQKGESFRADSLEELHEHPAWKGRHTQAQGGYEPSAFLGVPLKIVDRNSGIERVIGVLKLENIRPSPKHPEAQFTEQDVLLVTMMANVIATVVYNTLVSEAQLQRLNVNLVTLSQALAGGLEMGELVNKIVETMARALGAEAAALYLVDEESGRLVARAGAGYQAALVAAGASYNLGEGITGWIAQKGESFRADSLEELHEHPAWKGRHTQAQGGYEPSAFLGVPLKIVDRNSGIERVIGVLKLENIRPSPKHPEAQFTEQDVLLVTMMANVIATVVYNTQESENRLQRLSKDLQRLSVVLSGGRNMADLLNEVVKTTALVLSAEAASLFLIDEATNRLVIQAAVGYQLPLVARAASYGLGEGITGWIAQEGRLVHANSLEELHLHRAWQGKHTPFQGGREPDAFLGVPLKVAAKTIGVLKLENILPSPEHPEKHFTEQDVLLVTMMANVIATVVSNTRHGEEHVVNILRCLGPLSAPAPAAPGLLADFARAPDGGIVDQLARALVVTLDREPDRALEEARGLFQAGANPVIYGRVAARTQHDRVKWLFSLLSNILKKEARLERWEQVLQSAEPWLRLERDAGDPEKFAAAAQDFMERIAAALRTPAVSSHTDGSMWYATVLDTTSIFGDPLMRLPLLFQREGVLDTLNLGLLRRFAQSGMGPTHDALLLVAWQTTISARQIEQLQDSMRALADVADVAIATPADILRVSDAADPAEELRSLVLRQVRTRSIFVTVGAVPEWMFFGRERELNQIANYLNARHSCAVVGGRRIGKTSILFRLHGSRLHDLGFRTIYQDCAALSGCDEFRATPIHIWRPGAPPDAPRTMGELLHSPPDDRPLVLLLDEVDKLVPRDRDDDWRLFNALRAAANAGRLQVVLGGERVLLDGLGDPGGPLYNFADPVILGPLEFAAVAQLVTRPMRLLDIELVDPDAIVRRIYDLTSGHPNVVQRFGHRLVARLDEHRVRLIALADVNAVAADPDFQREMLATYWENATTLEKIISLLMAGDEKLRTLRAIRQALADHCRLHLEGGEVDDALGRLVKLRSILKRTRAGYIFAVESFPRVVAGTITRDDLLLRFADDFAREQQPPPKEQTP